LSTIIIRHINNIDVSNIRLMGNCYQT